MKTIMRRLCRLEEKVATHEIGGPSPAEVLRERRRRRFEASGLPYEERAPDPTLYEHGRRPTCAEILRGAHARRHAESVRAERAEQVL